ncbi:signal transduction histidine kinase [Amycolatopsis bartoniae]|uniref:histidine kinase n=1 Tax=Amycolatopsis bartoniae TaxID=941986 RepID=A0A8H9ITU9_9PSEU|nr:ATP-binding protein [Amycolatopsis bartoniae]MBB2937037.1 signal transduction histidine kinase [Amycolatopsis bartoniae]TVT01040.1 HAMP domain-containing protein [Amycolatopsis bartoniae]GHF51992.1 histidine kinase [Amycolatopsis bartoniae]
MLSIAFVPSIALLVAGVALAGYLLYNAVAARTFISKVHDSATIAVQFFASVQQERQLTLTDLATNGSVQPQLAQVRAKTDSTGAGQAQNLSGLYDQAPPRVQASINQTAANLAQLPEFRAKVDAHQVSLLDAYTFYNRILDTYTDGLLGVAEGTPDAKTAYLRATAMPLFVAADQMARSVALASGGIANGGLSDDEFSAFIATTGAYHAGFDNAVPEMIPTVAQQYSALKASPAWATVTSVEKSIIDGNHRSLPAGVTAQQWQAASTQVAGALMNLYIQQSTNATNVEIDTGNQMLVTAIAAGAAAIILALLVTIIAWRMSSRLVRRLHRLREETLEMADTQLPDLVGRVRNGEDVDLETEMSFLDHGEDEIGQVADAFNKAQQTAVAAAVDEAKTREGTSKVFLNIAHRSQVLVHRQLKALDEAERKQEDPDQLDLLFKLDHLSTRARRNAENLIILGGERPGRQWRNPVALADLIRGATAETEDYARVNVGKMPAVAVNGPVVADLIHLLAELIDNATSFSPPQSRVEVWGDVVGRGVVLEIEDQGLGMEPEQIDELNAMLADPPDFGVMALSQEPRLGLFVVARLASRHGISVTLRPSAYGGTRAIVLVRSELLTPVPLADEPEPAAPVPSQGQTASHPSLPVRRPQAVPSAEETARQVAGSLAQAQAQVDAAGSNGNGNGGRVDLFRPQREPRYEQQQPREPQQPQGRTGQHRAAPQPARPPQENRAPQDTRSRPQQGPLSPDRPQLPRRRRQQNLAPQLRTDEVPYEAPSSYEPREDPDLARSRLASFQQGTRRARDTDPAATDFFGERR